MFLISATLVLQSLKLEHVLEKELAYLTELKSQHATKFKSRVNTAHDAEGCMNKVLRPSDQASANNMKRSRKEDMCGIGYCHPKRLENKTNTLMENKILESEDTVIVSTIQSEQSNSREECLSKRKKRNLISENSLQNSDIRDIQFQHLAEKFSCTSKTKIVDIDSNWELSELHKDRDEVGKLASVPQNVKLSTGTLTKLLQFKHKSSSTSDVNTNQGNEKKDSKKSRNLNNLVKYGKKLSSSYSASKSALKSTEVSHLFNLGSDDDL